MTATETLRSGEHLSEHEQTERAAKLRLAMTGKT
jgi:hypothetical protein